MNVVLDTNVFLQLCAAEEETTQVYRKIINNNDNVVVDCKIIEEYMNVLTREGFGTRLVMVKLEDFNVRQRLRNITRRIPSLSNIVTHEKDRHLVECAHATNSNIITYEVNHMYNIRQDMETQLGILVLTPSEYLNL